MTAHPHPLMPLIRAARLLDIDSPPRVLAAIRGVLAAGVDEPSTVARALAWAGVEEAAWRAIAALEKEPS